MAAASVTRLPTPQVDTRVDGGRIVIEVQLLGQGPSLASATPPAGGPLLYRLRDAAAQLGVGETTLRELERRGDIRFLRIGGRVVVDRDELIRFRDRLRDEQLGGSP